MRAPQRGMLSRPSLDRDRSTGARTSTRRCATAARRPARTRALIELGLAHEQQHQELLLTDIKHALFQNPLGPAMWARARAEAVPSRAGRRARMA